MPNTKYNITLYSYNDGDKSDPTVILAQTALPAPLTFKVEEYGHDFLQLSWGNVIGASSYQLNVRFPNGTNHATYTIPGTFLNYIRFSNGGIHEIRHYACKRDFYEFRNHVYKKYFDSFNVSQII